MAKDAARAQIDCLQALEPSDELQRGATWPGRKLGLRHALRQKQH